MRILHLSFSDIAGGAARAAYRVHSGLLRLGHESRMLVLKKWSVDPTVTKFTPSRGLLRRLRHRVRGRKIAADFAPYKAKRPAGSEQFSDDRTEWRDEPLREIGDVDIIN